MSLLQTASQFFPPTTGILSRSSQYQTYGPWSPSGLAPSGPVLVSKFQLLAPSIFQSGIGKFWSLGIFPQVQGMAVFIMQDQPYRARANQIQNVYMQALSGCFNQFLPRPKVSSIPEILLWVVWALLVSGGSRYHIKIERVHDGLNTLCVPEEIPLSTGGKV
ncbi:hypothetical protein DFH09DRAFT_1077055 [Mycena vulgaris]|nr:hypothetical protein DFH09DRAFT_1077055 [Mycena vulgaris]